MVFMDKFTKILGLMSISSVDTKDGSVVVCGTDTTKYKKTIKEYGPTNKDEDGNVLPKYEEKAIRDAQVEVVMSETMAPLDYKPFIDVYNLYANRFGNGEPSQDEIIDIDLSDSFSKCNTLLNIMVTPEEYPQLEAPLNVLYKEGVTTISTSRYIKSYKPTNYRHKLQLMFQRKDSKIIIPKFVYEDDNVLVNSIECVNILYPTKIINV